MTRTSNLAAIEAVHTQARTLYRRTREAGLRYADIAIAVRALHSVLADLRSEAEDPDSLLHTNAQQHASVYSRQLAPLLEDCDFTFKQLNTILAKYGPRGSDRDRDSSEDDASVDSATRAARSREQDIIALVRSKLSSQNTNIGFFLDTVKLHRPSDGFPPSPVSIMSVTLSPDECQLNALQDKVDSIAARLALQRDLIAPSSGLGASSPDELWHVFHTELLYEGFSGDVLDRHEEKLRAYVQEIDTRHTLNATPSPTASFMPAPSSPQRASPSFLPALVVEGQQSRNLPQLSPGGSVPKEMLQSELRNEKFVPSVKESRPAMVPFNGQYLPYRPPQYSPPQQYRQLPESQQQARPPSPSPSSSSQQLALSPTAMVAHTARAGRDGRPPFLRSPSSSSTPPTPSSTSDDDSDDSSSRDLSLMLTSDLLAIDMREQERFAARVGVTYLYPQLLPPPPVAGIPSLASSAAYSISSDTAHAPQSPTTSMALQSISPRHTPPLPNAAAASSPPPPYNSSLAENAGAAYGIVVPASTAPSNGSTGPMPYMLSLGLAPDSQGNVIPNDAIWTKISRRLVSPEVLEHAGVRYEARPSFVAILGKLRRAEVAEYARKSAEARRARGASVMTVARPARGSSQTIDPRRPFDATFADSAPPTQSAPSTPTSSSDAKFSDASISKAKTFPLASSSKSFTRVRYKTTEKQKGRGDSEDDDSSSKNDGDSSGVRAYPFIVSPPSSMAGGIDKAAAAKPAKVTLRPRSILKNKNTNHVRYNKDGAMIEVSPDEDSSERERERDYSHGRDRERSRHRRRRHRDHDRDRETDREPERSRRDEDYARDRSKDRTRRRDSYSYTRDRYKDSDRERDRDRDREREKGRTTDRDRDSERKDRDARRRRTHDDKSREQDCDKDRTRERRYSHRSSRDYRDSRENRESRESRETREARETRDSRDNRDNRDGQKRDDHVRLRDTITSAGIGGATASILSILTEAANGL